MHILGSIEGYTTLRRSSGLDDQTVRELEHVPLAAIGGARSSAGLVPTFSQHLGDGRVAVRRILRGGRDDLGRDTVTVVSLVFEPGDYLICVRSLMSLLRMSSVWTAAVRDQGHAWIEPDGPELDEIDVTIDFFGRLVDSKVRATALQLAQSDLKGFAGLVARLHAEDLLMLRWSIGAQTTEEYDVWVLDNLESDARALRNAKPPDLAVRRSALAAGEDLPRLTDMAGTRVALKQRVMIPRGAKDLASSEGRLGSRSGLFLGMTASVIVLAVGMAALHFLNRDSDGTGISAVSPDQRVATVGDADKSAERASKAAVATGESEGASIHAEGSSGTSVGDGSGSARTSGDSSGEARPGGTRASEGVDARPPRIESGETNVTNPQVAPTSPDGDPRVPDGARSSSDDQGSSGQGQEPSDSPDTEPAASQRPRPTTATSLALAEHAPTQSLIALAKERLGLIQGLLASGGDAGSGPAFARLEAICEQYQLLLAVDAMAKRKKGLPLEDLVGDRLMNDWQEAIGSTARESGGEPGVRVSPQSTPESHVAFVGVLRACCEKSLEPYDAARLLAKLRPHALTIDGDFPEREQIESNLFADDKVLKEGTKESIQKVLKSEAAQRVERILDLSPARKREEWERQLIVAVQPLLQAIQLIRSIEVRLRDESGVLAKGHDLKPLCFVLTFESQQSESRGVGTYEVYDPLASDWLEACQALQKRIGGLKASMGRCLGAEPMSIGVERQMLKLVDGGIKRGKFTIAKRFIDSAFDEGDLEREIAELRRHLR
jgi:hypothetical protein